MQETSSITSENLLKKLLKNFALSVLSILTFSSGAIFAAAALSVDGGTYSHQNLINEFSLRSFSFRTITKEAFSFAHALPRLRSEIGSLGRSAIQSIPTDHASNISFVDTLPQIKFNAPSVSFQLPAFPRLAMRASAADEVALLHAEQREIAVAGTGLSLVGKITPSKFVPRSVTAITFSPASFSRLMPSITTLSIPRIAKLSIPQATPASHGIVLGASITADALALRNTKPVLPFIDRISLSLFCAFASGIDTNRCDYDAVANGSVLTPATTLVTGSPSNDTASAPVATATSSLDLLNAALNAKLAQVPVYITKYVTEYIPVPGPAGRDGRDGRDGASGVTTLNSIHAPVGIGSYVIPSNSYVSTPIGISTIAYLRGTTIEIPSISGGTALNLLLSSPTLTTATFNGGTVFNGSATFATTVSLNDFTATSSVVTNATTTNAFITNLFAEAATSTDSYITRLVAASSTLTDAMLTNSTTTNAYIANLIAASSTLTDIIATNATATNMFATSSSFVNAYIQNLSAGTTTANSMVLTGTLGVGGTSTLATTTATSFTAIDATSTTLFSTLLNTVTAFITNLTTTNATTTNFVATNSTTTNAFIQNLTIGSSTSGDVTVSGTLLVVGTSTFATTSATDFIANRATSTSLFSTLLTAVTGFFTDLTIVNATTTNFVGTNATTTNFFTQNIAVGNSNVQGNQSVDGTFDVTGTSTLGANVFLNGNVIVGTSSNEVLTVNALVNSNFVSAQNKIYDLGSASFYWRTLYADSINVNSISAASTTISGTSNNDFTINSDNGSADADDISLVFYRGLVTPNALLRWNSLTKRLESNMSFKIQNETPVTGTTTLTVQGGAAQGLTNLFELKTNSGTTATVFNASGWLGVGSSTPGSALSVVGDGYFGGNLTATGTLNVTGNTTLVNASTTVLTAPTLFFTNASGTAATIPTLYGTTGSFTTLTGTNASTTNLTGTNFWSTLANIVGLNVTNATTTGTFVVTGTSTLATTTISTLTVTDQTTLATASSTGLTATNLYSTLLNTLGTTTLATTGGNVGIGTTTPLAGLHIEGADNTELLIGSSNTTGTSIQLNNYTTGAHNYQFYTTGSSSGQGAGRFGVFDATSLNTPLSIYGGTSSTAGQYLSMSLNSVIGWGGTTIQARTPDTGFSRLSANKVVLGNGTQGDFTGTLIAGNVGIGSTTPGYKLSVVGDGYFGGNLTATGTLNVTGNTTLVNASTTVLTAPTLFFTNASGTAATIPTLYGTTGSFTTLTGTNASTTNLTVASNAYFGGNTGIWNSSGNVGIGTTTPAGKLSVKGDGTGTGFTFLAANSSNASLFAILDNGYVGIGTTSPAWPLTVSSNSIYGADMTLESLDTGGRSWTLKSSASGSVSAGGAGAFAIRDATAGLARMVISTSGNVGIGSTTPGSLLSVQGDGYFGGNLTATGTVTSLTNGSSFGSGASGIALTVAGGSLRVFRAAVSDFSININQGFTSLLANTNQQLALGSNGTEYMRINTSGNGSIGTSTPWAKLSIQNAYGSTTPLFDIATTTSAGFATSSLFTVLANGRVGIGSSTPGSLLSVQGDGYFGGNLTATGTLNVTGNTTLVNASTTVLTAPTLFFTNASGTAATIPTLYGTTGSFTTLTGTNASTTNLTVASNAYFGGNTGIWNSSGNVGIGTTTPAQKLQVNGTVRFGGPTAYVDFDPNGSLQKFISSWTSGDTHHIQKLGFTSQYGDTLFLGAPGNQASSTDKAVIISDNYPLAVGVSDGTGTGLSSTLFSVLASGNVGIGSTTPGYKLSVVGDGYFGGNLTATGTLNVTGNTTLVNASTTVLTAPTLFFTNASGTAATIPTLYGTTGSFTTLTGTNASTTNLTVASNAYFGGNTGIWNSSGNVGIGTSSPIRRLDVAQGTSAGDVLAMFSNTGATTNAFSIVDIRQVSAADSVAMLRFQNDADQWSVGIDGTDSDAFKISNSFAGTFTVPKLTVTTAGRVGIGTTTPSSMLQVSGGDIAARATVTTQARTIGVQASDYDANFQTARIAYRDSGFVGTAYGITGADMGSLDFVNATNAVIGTNGQTPIIFAAFNQERMRISGSNQTQGYIGIGKTTPTHQVDIIAGASTSPTAAFSGINISNVATSSTASIIKSGLSIASTGAWVGSNASNIGLYVSSVTGGTNNYDAIFNGGGNVGIGSTTPGSLLTVASSTATGSSSLFEIGTSTTLFNVLANGNVGIGSSSPSFALTVNSGLVSLPLSTGAGTTPNLIFGNATTSGIASLGNDLRVISNGTVRIRTAGAAVFLNGTTLVGSTTAAGGSNFNVLGNASVGSTYYALAAPTNGLIVEGNVGIGTSTPGSLLSVQGNGYFGGNLTATGTLNVTGDTTLVNGSSTAFTATNLYATLFNTTGTTTLATSGGSVGIGTTNPSDARLVISGTSAGGITGGINTSGTTLSSTGTTQQQIHNFGANVSPQGGTLTSLYGQIFLARMTNSSASVTNYNGIYSRLDPQSTYTGTISTASMFRAGSPSNSSGIPITSLRSFQVDVIDNGDGITSGAVANIGLMIQSFTASSSVGGTINNYGTYLNMPSGSPSGGTTNNYGLRITGNGGTSNGGTVNNYAIYNDSTANNYIAGNVGIGSSTPAYKLSVVGDGYFGGNLTATGTLNVTGNTTLVNASTTNLTVANNAYFGGNTGIWNGSGNVGIGTIIGNARLQVQSAATDYSSKPFKITDAAGASIITTTGDGRVFVGSDNGYDVALSVDLSGAKTTGSIARFGDSSGAIMLSSGSLVTTNTSFGFGSGNFGSAIEFVSPANNGMLRINGANTTIGQQSLGATPDKTLKVVNGSTTGATSFFVQESSAQSTSEVFGVYANDGTTSRLVVKGGNVGIGSTTPGSLLSVQGEGYFGGNLTATGTLNISGQTTLATASSTGLTVSGTSYFGGNTGIWNSSGNVGIGTTTPTTSLDILTNTANGSKAIKILGGNSTSGDLATIEAIGRRSDGNVSGSFAGTLALAKNRTDAMTSTSSMLGRMVFGGNHTDGSLSNILYSASIAGVSDGSFLEATTMPTALTFYTGTNGTTTTTGNVTVGTERMRITSAGNVGIGTTSPNALLSVGSGSLVDANVPVQISTGGAGTQSWYGVNKNGDYGLLMGYNNAVGGISAGIIRQTTTDNLEFWTNNTNRSMVINSSGNVGIGTTSPSTKLSVAGTAGSGATQATVDGGTSSGDYGILSISNGLTTKGRLVADATTNNFRLDTGGNSTGAMTFLTGSDYSEAARITSGGNVGIGTMNPGLDSYGNPANYKLSVFYAPTASTTVDDVVRITSKYEAPSGASAAVGSGPAIVFAGGIGDNQTRDRARIVAVYEGSNVSGLAFHTQNTADTVTEKMRIQNNGNVGIGTTNPGHKLQVVGANNATELKISSADQGSGALVLGDGSSALKNVGIWRGSANSYASNGNYMNFGTYGDGGFVWTTGNAELGSQTERMRLAADTGLVTIAQNLVVSGTGNTTIAGNVGIGSSTPGYTLSVVGDGYFGGNLTATGTLNISGQTTLATASSTGLTVSGTSYFGGNTGIWDSNGNVGIGTSSPIAILDVWGNVNVGTSSSSTFIVNTASRNVAIGTSTPAAATTKLSINGVPGDTALSITGLTTGTGINATTLSAGTALNVTVTTTGKGLTFNNSAAQTTASALNVTGSANMTGDYSGAYINVNPTKNMTAAATRTLSGNMLSISPTYSITGTSASVYNMTGTTTNMVRTLNNTSTSASSSLTVSAPLMALVNNKGAGTGAVTDTGVLLDIAQLNTAASGNLFNLFNAGTGNLAVFSGNGNVGIGTTTPSSKLFVDGTIRNSANVNSTGDAGLVVLSGDRLGFDESGTRSWNVKATGGNLAFSSGDGNGSVALNMGLIVSGATTSVRNLIPESNLTYTLGASSTRFLEGWFNTLNIGSSTWSLGQSATDSRFSIFDAPNKTGTERFTIATNGNIGIGTTTPGSVLTVQGNSLINGDLTVTGNLDAKMKQLTADYVVDTGSNAISVGDIVSYINGKATKVTSGVSSGSSVTLNSEEPAYIYAATLDSTHFVVVYKNTTTTTAHAVVSTVSGTTITAGTPVALNAVASNYVSVTALDSTHFVTAYQNTGTTYADAVVSTVSGTTITAGTPVTLNAAASTYVSAAALDSTHFVTAYKNTGTSYANAVVSSVSGTTITVGTPVALNAVASSYVSAAALDSTHFVTAYQNTGTTYADAVVSSVSGTTITVGTPVALNAAASTGVSVAALDLNHFVVAYKDGVTVSAVTSNVYGTIISADTPVILNALDTYANVSVTALDSAHIATAYQNNVTSRAKAVASLVSHNALGMATNAASAGGTVNVASNGIVSGLSGLTAGATYYASNTGTATTTVTSMRIGFAVSSTQMMLNSGPNASGDQYFGDMIFANAFRIAEGWDAPQSLVFKNQLGRQILNIDERGNLDISGSIFSKESLTLPQGDVSGVYSAVEAVDAGTVVAFATSSATSTATTTDPDEISSVRKASNGYEAVGVVSARSKDMPMSVINGVPVAFAGRVSVKVTDENGEVKRGDYLTVSLTRPGYAMKMTREGRSIGRAISDFVVGRDKVMMMVENGYQRIDLAGGTATTTMLTSGNLDLDANGVAIINIKSLASANGTWSIDEDGRIVAKVLCLEDVCIDKNTLTNILNSTGQTGVVAGTSTEAATDTSTTTASGDTAATSTDTTTAPAADTTTTTEPAPDTTSVAESPAPTPETAATTDTTTVSTADPAPADTTTTTDPAPAPEPTTTTADPAPTTTDTTTVSTADPAPADTTTP